MSVESFFSTYPADEKLKARMIREKLPNMSPVATFAAKLARDAGDGLREITNKLSGPGTAFRMNQASFQSLPQDDKEKIIVNHAGVLLGVSVPTLEDCIISGSFDSYLWCSLYNVAVAGTIFSTMKPEEGKSVEALSKDCLEKMRKLVGEDKTFAIFFEDSVSAMPMSLRNILTRSRLLPAIRQYILPSYKDRAKLVAA